MTKTTILPVVLCVCEVWSLTKKDGGRLMSFGKWIIRRLLYQRVTGGWRKLNNEGLSSLYSPPDSRAIKPRRQDGRYMYSEWVTQTRTNLRLEWLIGKDPLRRARRRWEDNIKWFLEKYGLGCGLNLSGWGYGPVASFCEPCYKNCVP
jgi:hypothetical protein